jgi:hypothetical protein
MVSCSDYSLGAIKNMRFNSREEKDLNRERERERERERKIEREIEMEK